MMQKIIIDQSDRQYHSRTKGRTKILLRILGSIDSPKYKCYSLIFGLKDSSAAVAAAADGPLLRKPGTRTRLPAAAAPREWLKAQPASCRRSLIFWEMQFARELGDSDGPNNVCSVKVDLLFKIPALSLSTGWCKVQSSL